MNRNSCQLCGGATDTIGVCAECGYDGRGTVLDYIDVNATVGEVVGNIHDDPDLLTRMQGETP